jgi:hypothetical protein
MSRLFAAVLAVLVACTLAACSDEGTYSPPDTGTVIASDLPAGMIEAPADRGKPVVGGVYRDASNNCCWASPSVHARVQKSDLAGRLDLTIYLPDAATFRATPQAITARIDGGPPFQACCFGPGNHDVLMQLPAVSRTAAGPVSVDLTMKVAWIPKNDGMGPDSRRLALILQRLHFVR